MKFGDKILFTFRFIEAFRRKKDTIPAYGIYKKACTSCGGCGFHYVEVYDKDDNLLSSFEEIEEHKDFHFKKEIPLKKHRLTAIFA